MENVVLDYRFSLFGIFDVIRNNVSHIIKDNPFFFNHRIDGDDKINGMSIPVFLLEAKDCFLRIGNSRIDIILKSKRIEDNVDISLALGIIKNYLPLSFDRIAINYSYNFVDESGTLLNQFIKKSNTSFGIGETRNFSLKQAFSSLILKTPFNNLITIQTVNMLNKNTFETKKAISCLIDINSMPANEVYGVPTIKKEEVLEYFAEAKKIAVSDFEKVEAFFKI